MARRIFIEIPHAGVALPMVSAVGSHDTPTTHRTNSPSTRLATRGFGGRMQALSAPSRRAIPTSWIVVWMIRANLAASGESAGVLDAAALAVVSCGAEPLLVCVVRVLEESDGQA